MTERGLDLQDSPGRRCGRILERRCQVTAAVESALGDQAYALARQAKIAFGRDPEQSSKVNGILRAARIVTCQQLQRNEVPDTRDRRDHPRKHSNASESRAIEISREPRLGACRDRDPTHHRESPTRKPGLSSSKGAHQPIHGGGLRGQVPTRPTASPCSAPGRSCNHAAIRSSICCAVSAGYCRFSRCRMRSTPASNMSSAARIRWRSSSSDTDEYSSGSPACRRQDRLAAPGKEREREGQQKRAETRVPPGWIQQSNLDIFDQPAGRRRPRTNIGEQVGEEEVAPPGADRSPPALTWIRVAGAVATLAAWWCCCRTRGTTTRSSPMTASSRFATRSDVDVAVLPTRSKTKMLDSACAAPRRRRRPGARTSAPRASNRTRAIAWPRRWPAGGRLVGMLSFACSVGGVWLVGGLEGEVVWPRGDDEEGGRRQEPQEGPAGRGAGRLLRAAHADPRGWRGPGGGRLRGRGPRERSALAGMAAGAAARRAAAGRLPRPAGVPAHLLRRLNPTGDR